MPLDSTGQKHGPDGRGTSNWSVISPKMASNGKPPMPHSPSLQSRSQHGQEEMRISAHTEGRKTLAPKKKRTYG